MNGKDKCYDNAVQESFFHKLKTELFYQQVYNICQEEELSILK